MRQGAASTVRFHSSVVIGSQKSRESLAPLFTGAKRAKILLRGLERGARSANTVKDGLTESRNFRCE